MVKRASVGQGSAGPGFRDPGLGTAGVRVLHFLCLGVFSGIEFTLTFACTQKHLYLVLCAQLCSEPLSICDFGGLMLHNRSWR